MNQSSSLDHMLDKVTFMANAMRDLIYCGWLRPCIRFRRWKCQQMRGLRPHFSGARFRPSTVKPAEFGQRDALIGGNRTSLVTSGNRTSVATRIEAWLARCSHFPAGACQPGVAKQDIYFPFLGPPVVPFFPFFWGAPA